MKSRIGFKRVAIAGDDHPGGERAGALLAERIEALVDDHAGVGLAGAGALDRFGNALVDRIRDRLRKLALKPGGGAEMVEQVGVGAADLRGDRLQGHRLRPLVEQQLARRGEGGGAAFFGGQARTSY